MKFERFDTVVIGGGEAGLAMAYYLKEQGRDFVVLEAGDRIGNARRRRWESLWLFAPAALKGLSGMPFPFPGGYFPTKDETADYFEECVAMGVARPRGSPRRAARDREVGADR